LAEETVDDLGENELDGGVVLEEGDDDVGGMGEDGVAVVLVGPAEVAFVERVVFAAMAAGGDHAAAGLCCWCGFGGVGGSLGGFGHVCLL
jgi:hypothetical protein